jgi:hypothetical protein
MRRFFSMLVLLVAGVAALGFYQGWFHVSTSQSALADQMDLNLHINKSKIRADARKARDAARNLRGDFEKWLDEPADD